jgi:AcrR family transcriptional regulator
MEALASSENVAGKPNDLLAWSEAQITELLREILPSESEPWLTNHRLAHLLMMAQDGFIINHRWGESADVDSVAAALCDTLLPAIDRKPVSTSARTRKRAARTSTR